MNNKPGSTLPRLKEMYGRYIHNRIETQPVVNIYGRNQFSLLEHFGQSSCFYDNNNSLLAPTLNQRIKRQISE